MPPATASSWQCLPGSRPRRSPRSLQWQGVTSLRCNCGSRGVTLPRPLAMQSKAPSCAAAGSNAAAPSPVPTKLSSGQFHRWARKLTHLWQKASLLHFSARAGGRRLLAGPQQSIWTCSIRAQQPCGPAAAGNSAHLPAHLPTPPLLHFCGAGVLYRVRHVDGQRLHNDSQGTGRSRG